MVTHGGIRPARYLHRAKHVSYRIPEAVGRAFDWHAGAARVVIPTGCCAFWFGYCAVASGGQPYCRGGTGSVVRLTQVHFHKAHPHHRVPADADDMAVELLEALVHRVGVEDEEEDAERQRGSTHLLGRSAAPQ